MKIYSAGAVSRREIISGRQHEAILHVLDRVLPGDEGELPKYYPASAFESTISAWEGIPLIFERGGQHVDLDLFVADKEAELKRVGAFDIGTVGQTWIDRHGRAKLMGMLNIRNPDEARSPEERKAILLAEKLFNEGKLSPSTGFYATAMNDGVMRTITGGIRPNHLLLFEESDATGSLPRDLGAQILNKVRPCQLKQKNVGEKMPDNPGAPAQSGIAPGVLDRLKTLFSEALSILDGKAAPEQNPVTATKDVTPKVTTMPAKNSVTEDDKMVDAELKSQVEKLTADMAAMKETNTKLEAEKKILEARVAAIDAAEKETQWNTVKAKLEVGLVDTAEKNAAERAKFDKDPVAYMLTAVVVEKQANTKKEGVDAGKTGADPEVEAYVKVKNAQKSVMRRNK